MMRLRFASALVTMAFAATAIAPAAELGSSQPVVVAQQGPGAMNTPPAAKPKPKPPQNNGKPVVGGGQKPPGGRPPTPRPKPPGGGGQKPPGRPPTFRPRPPTPRPRPPTPRPKPPPPRPIAPWKPNRPPAYRPPNTGWQRPPWANYPRPPWANNGNRRPNYILVNPRPYNGNWGWNNGNPWTARPTYWGGGFWGAFSLFSLAAGAAIWSQNRYTTPSVGAPGYYLFENYGLQAAPCGRQNLVYIYGPNNSVMCAYPNQYVQTGTYYVDPVTLQLLVM
jgi:hypothetical protein